MCCHDGVVLWIGIRFFAGCFLHAGAQQFRKWHDLSLCEKSQRLTFPELVSTGGIVGDSYEKSIADSVGFYDAAQGLDWLVRTLDVRVEFPGLLRRSRLDELHRIGTSLCPDKSNRVRADMLVSAYRCHRYDG